MKLSTSLKRLLTQANPRPKRPVLSLISGGSELEQDFAALWRQFGQGPAPVREFQFAKLLGRRWRFDFAWPDRLVAVELEGLTHGAGGRHQRIAGFADDCEKYNTATLFGWAVLRFTGRDLKRRPLQIADMVQTLLDAADVGGWEG